jgi:hypothetical protein
MPSNNNPSNAASADANIFFIKFPQTTQTMMMVYP